jgi:glucosamine-6-phosphate deaminase
MRSYDLYSHVEKIALEKSGLQARFAPTEKISVVQATSFPTLGKLTALRFLEWLQRNPEGVISLPTGKTPEYFIKWTSKFLSQWNNQDIQQELAGWGLDPTKKPDMRSFTFVQIDEFFPMNPQQENSFAAFIERFYLKEFGLDKSKALLMDTWSSTGHHKNLGELFPGGKVDLNARLRMPKTLQEERQRDAIFAADQQAMEFELRVRNLGGIGFFLGGIGPDGHIAFNIKGSDHLSTTRLLQINYPTAAASASDLGGIELARDRVVMTIGLATITYNPTVTAIVFAAGESKAKIIRSAVEEAPSILYPATVLHSLLGGRFYLTAGAASQLTQRIKKIDFEPAVLDQRLKNTIIRSIEPKKNSSFLHTGPHHDDIMLGCLPLNEHLMRDASTKHMFVTMTSGFNAVTNTYARMLLVNLEKILQTDVLDNQLRDGFFAPENLAARNEELQLFWQGVVAKNTYQQDLAVGYRMLRNLIELTKFDQKKLLLEKIAELCVYFDSSYPGRKDIPLVQAFKGMLREWEEELVWAKFGQGVEHVRHMRLSFYTGDLFTPQPSWERDIKAIYDLLVELHPDVITVTMDPEGSGPDTHYKVLQAIAQALKLYVEAYPDKKIRVWGYRNVWYRFDPLAGDILFPVSMEGFTHLKDVFMTCYGSQRTASFPSTDYDGPFCDIIEKVSSEQLGVIKKYVGQDFFDNNSHELLRSAHGFLVLRDISPQEFFDGALSIKQQMELQESGSGTV